MKKNSLPQKPFHNQEFIDAFRVKWIYDADHRCWKRSGSVVDMPVATTSTSGLLSSKDKGLIDSIPSKAGGYGIIIDPKLQIRSSDNPDGVITGEVKIISESLVFNCVMPDDRPIPDNCGFIQYSPEVHPKPPGFDIAFSDDFLSNTCVEIPGGQGPMGEKGEKGRKGRDGTGDGPQGEKGDPGSDATEPATFSGVKINDVSDIYDTAVVDMELDAENGKLKVLKGKMQLPNSDTPAEQLVASPIYRSIEFTDDDWSFKVTRPEGDVEKTSLDVFVAHYPEDVKFADIETGSNARSDIDKTQISARHLSEFINDVIDQYNIKLNEVAESYDAQIEEFIKELDEAARQKLDILTEELANSEFQKPIEHCIGLSPEDCQNEGAITSKGGSPGELCQLAESIVRELLPDSGISCLNTDGEDLGIFTLEPNTTISVSYPTQDGVPNLPSGIYALLYEGGSYFNSDDPAAGYYVWAKAVTGDVSAVFPEPDVTQFDRYSPGATEDYLASRSVYDRMLVVALVPDGGLINVEAPSGSITGSVRFRVVRCTECSEGT